MPKSNPIDQTRLTLAALAACLVDALGEQDDAVRVKFLDNLTKIYNNIRAEELSHIGAMETLTWTQEFLQELRK